jgi:hypothetical protein
MMNLRIQRPFILTPRRQEGSVSVLMVFALAAMAMMAALALDGGHMLLNKTRLQNAVDAAALSGAKTLSQVTGGINSASTTRTAALNTLRQNANATGNSELATAVGGNANFAVVELASSVYGPFSYPGPADAKYVRVSVPSYNLTGFFWNFAQVFGSGGLGTKAVAAIATAGPSPTSPCDLAPLLVCGDPTKYNPGAGMFWGFQFGDLQALKTGSDKSTEDDIGPGNYQLLDFGSGGKDISDDMAGGGEVCHNVGDEVKTAPGNKVGPTSQGLNTRFGIYDGSISASKYPPDLVTKASTPAITDDGTTGPKYDGQTVTSNKGDLTAGGNAILDYNDWRASVASCVAGTGGDCKSNGVFERRMLKIVVGDCTGKNTGTTLIRVLGFGCYFVVQPMDKGGKNSEIFGQFVKECEGDNVAGPSPSTDSGPQIIQLYKTYLNGSGTPSTDS